MTQKIEPIQFWDKQAELIYIQVNNIRLNHSANIYYQLRVAPIVIEATEERPQSILQSETLKEGNLTIQGVDYQAWGADDSYIVDMVIEKLGLVKA